MSAEFSFVWLKNRGTLQGCSPGRNPVCGLYGLGTGDYQGFAPRAPCRESCPPRPRLAAHTGQDSAPTPLPRLHSRPRLSAGLTLLEKGACRLFSTLIQSSVLFHSLPFPIPCAEQRSPPPPSTLRDLTLTWAGPYGKTAPFSCIASCVFYHSKEIKPYLSPSVWLFALSVLFICQLSS